MSTYETFVFFVVGLALFILLLTIIGIGGLLTVTTVSIAMINYYPIRWIDWLVSKVKKGIK